MTDDDRRCTPSPTCTNPSSTNSMPSRPASALRGGDEPARDRRPPAPASSNWPRSTANSPANSKNTAPFRPPRKPTRKPQALAGIRRCRTCANSPSAELPALLASRDAALEPSSPNILAADELAVDSMILEIRAGTGGDEAALFAGDLAEMYRRFCEKMRWKWEVMDFSPGDMGGFRDIVVNIKGEGAYRALAFEGGGHRVQRVPVTETQGRIHTSRRHRRRPARGRRIRHRDQPRGRARGRVPCRRPRRPGRQQDRIRRAAHPPAHRHRRADARGTQPAQEPRQGLARPALPRLRAFRFQTPRRARPACARP